MNLSLRQFFDETYRPDRLQQASADHVRKCLGIIERFGRQLGRDATLDDLTQANLDEFASKMQYRRLGKRHVDNTLVMLRSFWRHAFKAGMVDGEPEKRPRGYRGYSTTTPANWPTGSPNFGAEMPLLKFYKQVYEPQRLVGHSSVSHKFYETAVKKFSAYLGRDALIGDATEENLSAWLADMLRQRFSPVTCNGNLRRMMTLIRFAHYKRHIDGDVPNVRPAPVNKRLPRAWTVEQFENILASCKLVRERYMGIDGAKWWYALMLVLYDTGLRRRAALGIRFDEIDFPNKMLRVPPERMKTRVEQYFLLHDQTIKAILDTLPPRRSLLFPMPFGQHNSLHVRLKIILRRAGLPCTRFDMFHKIRRTTASHIAAAAGEAMASKHLGHQDASTIKRYVDPTFTSKQEAVGHLPRPAWDDPVEITIQPLAKPEPAKPTPVTYSVTQADLAGAGSDPLERLLHKEKWEAADVYEALIAVGMRPDEMAAEIGIDPKHFLRVMRGVEPFSRKMIQKVRVALGLSSARRGEANREFAWGTT